MNQRDEAALEMHRFFEQINAPYAIIGGLAVQHWGEPRFTQDVDITVTAPLTDEFKQFIQTIVDQFSPRIEDAVTFAQRNRVILIEASNGCPVDISLALPGYEDEMMQRVMVYELEPGKKVTIIYIVGVIPMNSIIAGSFLEEKEITLRQLMLNPVDGFLYAVDMDDQTQPHHLKLLYPTDLPASYLPAEDTYYQFEPIYYEADTMTETVVA